MMQMMARQMGLNANVGGRNNQNGNNQDGTHNGGEQVGNNFGHAPQQARTMSSRPMIPTFPPRAPEQPVPEPQITDIQDQLRRDWEAGGPDFTVAITFREYMDVWMKHMPRGHDNNQSYELRKKVGKLQLPYYDGSGKSTARAWVQKLDTYFQLNPMPEEEAIKYAAIHLDGLAHEWWHHGMVTMGHAHITSYVEFTERLIERFDRKDPELHFKELAQLKQWGSLETYISEFQKLAMLVTDVFERRILVLFMDGLADPLRGLIKALNPPTLQEAIKKARHMDSSSASKNKFQAKSFPSRKDKDSKPFHREAQPPKEESKRLDNETLNDLRKKKLCFHCREPWDLSHKCPLKAKAKQMEYFSAEESVDGDSEQSSETDGDDNSSHEEAHSDSTIAQMSRIQEAVTFKVRGTLDGQRFVALIDTGATHNFIDEKFVSCRGLHTEEHKGFKVMVADGFKIDCTKKISNLQLRLGDYDMVGDFFVINIGDQDMVLG
jgi:hypothetical protein